MISNGSVTNCALISTESAKDNVSHALRLFMGRGRHYSVEDVAEGTGIKDTTLYSYVRDSDRHTPTGDTLIRLCHFFGPGFTAKVFRGTGLGAHYLDAREDDPASVIAQLAKGTGEFAARGADHRFCYVDKGELEPVADEMILVLQPFSSKRGA